MGRREAPTVPIITKLCMVDNLADIITYTKFQLEIFRGYDFTGVELPIFTALHVMHTRSIDEISVCPSVHLSVCPSVKRVDCDETKEKSDQIFIPCERTFTLVL